MQLTNHQDNVLPCSSPTVVSSRIFHNIDKNLLVVLGVFNYPFFRAEQVYFRVFGNGANITTTMTDSLNKSSVN